MGDSEQPGQIPSRNLASSRSRIWIFKPTHPGEFLELSFIHVYQWSVCLISDIQ